MFNDALEEFGQIRFGPFHLAAERGDFSAQALYHPADEMTFGHQKA